MKPNGLVLIMLLTLALFTGMPGLGPGLAAAETSGGVVRADFNGDGWADLAIGIPAKDIGEERAAGAVVVIYGSSSGLNAVGGNGIPSSQFWTQNSPGVPGTSEEYDFFGSALAAGDFNNDGFSDLAIGVPREDVDGYPDLGAVNILYGSAQGLATEGEAMVIPAKFWATTQFQEIIDGVETLTSGDEHFGSALAVGDFNNDGFGDLAIGIPNKDFTFQGDHAGAVLVLYGSNDGLTDEGHQFWHQGPLIGGREDGDLFGAALAAGDFNGDGKDDLAIGVPGEDINTFVDAGAVNVIYGSENGLTSSGNQMWHKDSPGIIDSASNSQRFGEVLAAGDFNGDGKTDLAVGVPFHNFPSADDAGSVSVIYGSETGLTAAGNRVLTQNQLFTPRVEQPEEGDLFGWALAAGDFNGDGKDDLAIGVPGESVKSTRLTNLPVVDAGAVNVVYGSATGLITRYDGRGGPKPQIWHQEKLGNLLEEGDHFGSSLSASNFGRNLIRFGHPTRVIATADLAIGVPNEDVWSNPSQNVRDAGAVNVIYGSTAGLSVAHRYPGPGPSQIWMQGVDGVPGSSATDHFGASLY